MSKKLQLTFDSNKKTTDKVVQDALLITLMAQIAKIAMRVDKSPKSSNK